VCRKHVAEGLVAACSIVHVGVLDVLDAWLVRKLVELVPFIHY
jgi:hypothetical protein